MRVSDSLLARLRFLLYAVALLIWIAFPPLVNASNTTLNQAIGFNLYGPSGLSFAGQVTVTNGSSATAQHTLVNGAAMSVLVQVYNYTNGGSHHFFNLSYPGGDSALSVTMNVTPVYSGAGQAVGFH